MHFSAASKFIEIPNTRDIVTSGLQATLGREKSSLSNVARLLGQLGNKMGTKSQGLLGMYNTV